MNRMNWDDLRFALAVAEAGSVNAAARRLLEALPQITPEQVQTLIDYRTGGDFIAVEEIRDLIGAQTFSAISPYITLSLSPYYTIRAEGRVTGSSVRQIIQAMVHIDATLPGDYRIISWQDPQTPAMPRELPGTAPTLAPTRGGREARSPQARFIAAACAK